MRLALKVAILQTGRTQRSIARELGIGDTRLSNIVQGWIAPSADEREAIKRLTGVDDDAFRPERTFDPRSRW